MVWFGGSGARGARSRPGGRPGAGPLSPSPPLGLCRRIHAVSQCVASARVTVRPSPSAPASASQSASSFPGTFVCARTCRSSTSRGRRCCSRRHMRRMSAIMFALRRPFARGIHLPVVIFRAYSESVWMASRPAPRGRASACSRAYHRAESSPVLFVRRGANVPVFALVRLHLSCAHPRQSRLWGPGGVGAVARELREFKGGLRN